MSTKTQYENGYNHCSRKRSYPITVRLNEAEFLALSDLMAVLCVQNKSTFLRTQIFTAFDQLTPAQRLQLQELANRRIKDV